MHGMDAFTEQAMGILTSSRLAEALDLSKEDPRVVERYGTGDDKVHIDGNGAPRVPQSFLVATAAGRGRACAWSRSTTASGTGTATLTARASIAARKT